MRVGKNCEKGGVKTRGFSQLLEKNSEMDGKTSSKKPEKVLKQGCFRVGKRLKTEKMKFFLTEYQRVDKKSKKKCVVGEQRYWKNTIFAVPIERETG